MKSRDLPPQPSALSQALKRTFGLFRSRTDQDARPPSSRQVEFESLEPRLLLSADPLLTAAALAAAQQQEQAPQSAAHVVADSPPPTVHIAAPNRQDDIQGKPPENSTPQQPPKQSFLPPSAETQ